MELQDLEQGLRSVASGGCVLSCEELLALEAGLTLLKAREKHQAIFLWGKIFGKVSDYYIAYGLRTGPEYPSKVFYYSREDFDFHSLPRLTEEVGEQISRLELALVLTGNPNTLLESGSDASALTELQRLAQIVQEIDFDTAVVPKGAYALNEMQAVVPSSEFHGLDLSKASSLQSYVHFRPPASVASLKALAANDVEFYNNFLDTLEVDLPKGCWALRQDPLGALVTLRSLTWPGYISFHVPGTSKFGGVYFGPAQKNTDLPFIL